MQTLKLNHLKKLLLNQAGTTSDDALKNNGDIPKEKIDHLVKLERLVNICEKNQRKTHWPFIVILCVTLVIISILFFGRVSKTEIEMDVSLESLSFTLSEKQVIFDAMQLSSIGISGFKEIQLPQLIKDRIINEENLLSENFEDVGDAISLEGLLKGERRGTITLDALVLPAGAHVKIKSTDLSRQFRLSISHVEPEIRVYVKGLIRVGLSNAPAMQAEFRRPKAILLTSSSHGLDLDLTFPNELKKNIFSQLPVNHLSHFRVEEFFDTKHSIARNVSTIESGTVYFESLNGKKHPLRQGENIQFKVSDGLIRSIRLNNPTISLKFYGIVDEINTGRSENKTSLMPTWLEWLQARHGLSLFWGATIYLFGLSVTVLRWWGKIR